MQARDRFADGRAVVFGPADDSLVTVNEFGAVEVYKLAAPAAGAKQPADLGLPVKLSGHAGEVAALARRRDGSVAIHQQILVGRDTQKAIVLGRGGTRIKEIGARAREELAKLLGRKVHLFLHVKVNPRWEEDRGLYREIGLDWVR